MTAPDAVAPALVAPVDVRVLLPLVGAVARLTALSLVTGRREPSPPARAASAADP